jgi:hypothetical protein
MPLKFATASTLQTYRPHRGAVDTAQPDRVGGHRAAGSPHPNLLALRARTFDRPAVGAVGCELMPLHTFIRRRTMSACRR